MQSKKKMKIKKNKKIDLELLLSYVVEGRGTVQDKT